VRKQIVDSGAHAPGRITAGAPEARVAAINMRIIIDRDLDTLPIEKMDDRNNG